jgi:formylglycine-generating enzyme required for sulfatase activity
MRITKQHVVDITELAALCGQFPLRLMQLGFRLIQVVDDAGQDQYRYIAPPVCHVPAGPFLIGSDSQRDSKAKGDEFPQHEVMIEAFEIGVYPLTVAEYACFVQATSHAAPIDWGDQQRFPDHPIVFISWYDLLDYTQWFAQVTGGPWRPPTEAEWEKAARGDDGRIYPWGNTWDTTRANTREGGQRMTTPVGRYPAGVSPYGVHDMAGNVWEWTITAYKQYPYQASDGLEDLNRKAVSGRVTRGGSWNNYRQNTRAARRGLNTDTGSNRTIGARLVHGNMAG